MVRDGLRWAYVVPLALCACATTQTINAEPDLSETRLRFEDMRADLRRELLTRNRVAGPSLARTSPQSTRREGLAVTVQPASAETQTWNAWPDGTARLFNDSAGYLWIVEVDSPGPVTWLPAATQLAVNDTEQVYSPAIGPDLALQNLILAARLETMLGSPGDLDQRVRAADAFRQAYLSTAPREGDHVGVLLFPAPAARIHAVAMELRLAFETPSGIERFSWLFE